MHEDTKELNEKFLKLGYKPTYDEVVMQQRIEFIEEEFTELVAAVYEDNQAEALDALVDIVVMAMGTAWAMSWDFETAWNKVHKANMEKYAVRGKADGNRIVICKLVKPPSWVHPDLQDCVGE